MVNERKRSAGSSSGGHAAGRSFGFWSSSTRDGGQRLNAKRRRRALDKVTKHLRFSLATKKAKLSGMDVEYFVGSAAVDALLASKWATDSKPTDTAQSKAVKPKKNAICLFHTRRDCVEYMQSLIDRNMIHRSLKVYKPDQGGENGPRKRKFKLDVHDLQTFIDSDDDIYVWVYEPATWRQYLFGGGIVSIVIVCCLFPLWPAKVRSLAVYGSLCSAGLLGVLLALTIIKYVLFAAVWLWTRGRVRFWFLPNLSEDVGFLESFVPVYEIKHRKGPDKRKAVCAKGQVDEPLLSPLEEEEVPLNGNQCCATFPRRDSSSPSESHTSDGNEEPRQSTKEDKRGSGSSTEDFVILSDSEIRTALQETCVDADQHHLSGEETDTKPAGEKKTD